MRDDHPLIPTFTGKRVNPMHLEVEDVDILDIAHHLSMICRYTGATEEHYSVAQHSLIVSAYCPGELKLAGLLHDAPEAYMGDLTHPIKHHTLMGTMFRNVERFNELQIERAFGLRCGYLSHPDVKAVDEMVFDREWETFIDHAPSVDSVMGDKRTPWLLPMTAKSAETMFLNRFDELVS
jgi:hypothetical protein